MFEDYKKEENECDEGALVEGNEVSEDASSFIDLYKYSNRTMSFTQEKRRELFLQKQKEKRCEAFDQKRDLPELFLEESPDLMECESSSVWKARKKFPFGFKLMQSEWLTEVPDDLAENWLVKLCPEGIRYLVVAYKAKTICYFRNGRPHLRFKSNLPGGDSDSLGHRFTVLDCVFIKETNTFLVYDILAWNSMSLINAEAHMRFFWLRSKFEENPEFCKTKHPKNYQFIVVDFFPAQTALLQDQLFTPVTVNETELSTNGVLFYHREGHYVFGNSPLVGWLKTFMISEILHIDVPPCYMQNKPENYQSLQQYLKSKKRKRKKNQNTDVPMMEAEEVEAEENIECDNM